MKGSEMKGSELKSGFSLASWVKKKFKKKEQEFHESFRLRVPWLLGEGLQVPWLFWPLH